ncbi:hypothetical protein SAMN05519103_06389 [Rhizobiales bacterium GAS113]|nr:hypothetical protein SAMN05519103_06389 [Rhizobiales bacterium GAS113]
MGRSRRRRDPVLERDRHARGLRAKGSGKYLLKGTNPVYAGWYGVNHVYQGIVHGKRSGFSRSLGPTVRKRLGIKPRRPYFTAKP